MVGARGKFLAFVILSICVCVYLLYIQLPNVIRDVMLHRDGRFGVPDQIKENKFDSFKIVILTQRRYWSLKRLLDSLEATEFFGNNVTLEIRIDLDSSKDHIQTIEVAKNFSFSHGSKRIVRSDKLQGLLNAWFYAWTPTSDTDRALILEDDMELSPLWYGWMQRAWKEYGHLSELGGIALCRQRLNATNGQIVMVQNDTPFLYRLFCTHGFSPNARYWRGFIEWARRINITKTDVTVQGIITSIWWKNKVVMWSQYYIWWCASLKQLYTLYVHSEHGALVAHWQERGLHSSREKGSPSEKLLVTMEPLLQNFPKVLPHYGWNFRLEKYNVSKD